MSPASCGRQAVASILALACVSIAPEFAAAAPAGAGVAAPRPPVLARPVIPAPPVAIPRPPLPPVGAVLHHRRPQYGVNGWPATFRPSATWRQQHFRHPSPHGVIVDAPMVINAPIAAGTYGPGSQPYDDQGLYEPAPEPCAAPLIIRIGDAGPHASNVRVVHAQTSPCSTPQVVRYAGPKVVDVAPSVGSRRVHSVRKPARGITVVRPPHRH